MFVVNNYSTDWNWRSGGSSGGCGGGNGVGIGVHDDICEMTKIMRLMNDDNDKIEGWRQRRNLLTLINFGRIILLLIPT